MSRSKWLESMGELFFTVLALTIWFGMGSAEMNSGEASAELTLDESSTLADYLAYGVVVNPKLKAAFHRWQATMHRIPQATALPDPTVSFGYFIQETETRVGPQRAKVGLSQMLPWFGKRGLRGDVAQQAAHAAWADYEAKKLELFYSIEKAYWEYWFLARSVEVTAESKRLLTYLEGVARRKYAAGTAPYSAVIKAQVELGKLEDRLVTLRDRRFPVSAKLNVVLGRSDDTLLPWPVDAPEDTTESTLNAERLSALLEQNNPELKRAASMVAREEARVTLTKRNYYPDLGFGLDYVFTGKSDIGNPEDSGKDAVVAMVSLNIPISIGKYRAARREAEAAHLAAEMALQNRKNHLKASLQNAMFEFRDAERKIGLYRDTLLPKADQALEVARQAFEGGGVDFLDLIDAERTLLEFDLSYAKALSDRAIRQAEIEMLLGADMTAPSGQYKSESVRGMQ